MFLLSINADHYPAKIYDLIIAEEIRRSFMSKLEFRYNFRALNGMLREHPRIHNVNSH